MQDAKKFLYEEKTYIAKISVEEFLDTNTNEIKRKAYHLKGIKIETADGRAIEGNPTNSTSRSDTISIESIADLFQVVKPYDAVKYLPYIKSITENAVLYDSYISDKDNALSVMYHKFYAYTGIWLSFSFIAYC